MYLANPAAVHCISADCCIDARTLESDLALIEYLRGIDESRFTVYQAAIGA
jgi:hypothetical protein